MVDFTSVLNKVADTVEKPKPIPVGTYLAVVQGVPAQKTVKVQGEDRLILSFKTKLMSAREDVDADQLSALGDITALPPLSKDIWVDTQQGEFELREFLARSLVIESSGKTLGEMCGEAPGRQFLVTVKHRPFTDKNGQPDIAAEIGSTAAL
jgi:hypothetical protein